MPTADPPPNNPERFLDLIRRQQRGKLKIYLGFAAGVGKTFEMLQEGNRLRKQGVDVVIGYVETHGRVETIAQIGELEQVARRKIEYRGILLEEMDLNAVLARRPTIALVDELAHTNAPGSRNPKRYLDVEELLRRESASSPRSTSSTWRACTTLWRGPRACGSRSGCRTTWSRWPTRS